MDNNEIEKIVQEVMKKTSAPQGMTLALAVKLIEKVEAKAAEWGMRVVTAVSDASGRPVAVHCMDGAYIGSFDVALNKTYTSVAFQMSTAKLGTLSQPGESLYGIQFTNGGKDCDFRRRGSTGAERKNDWSTGRQRRNCKAGYRFGSLRKIRI